MHTEERIRNLERSVQLWRLISLALTLALASCLAISCTFGIVWVLSGTDLNEIQMLHDDARRQAEMEQDRAEEARRELELARRELQAARDLANEERARAQIEAGK